MYLPYQPKATIRARLSVEVKEPFTVRLPVMVTLLAKVAVPDESIVALATPPVTSAI
jgi:hypothetical protein